MHIRALKPSDIPALKALHTASGFPYEFPDIDSPRFEVRLVAVDENGNPVAAVLSERIAQLYLICGKFRRPTTGLFLIREFHKAMRPLLAKLGYHDINAFLPPEIEKSFGRRLMRSFGWQPNWKSWFARIEEIT